MKEPLDIKNMPWFNPSVTNGIDSVTCGLVKLVSMYPIWYNNRPYIPLESELSGKPRHPHCHRHGAMLRVSREGIWRCGELGCDVGCWWP